MLAHLRVANLGVLEDSAIDPSPGFTVITGETGAGKTLLLGGLRLILGGRPDPGAVGPLGEQAQVDALFVVEDEELGASRVVPREGRSRAHLEGTIVSAATLGERLGSVVEIVGQHDQLSITKPSHLLAMIDGMLDERGTRAEDGYRQAWAALQEALRRRERLGGDQIALARELDLVRYQATEISAASLEAGLDERAEAEVSRLRNVEEIREHLAVTARLIETMADTVGELVSRLRKASEVDPSLGELAITADSLADEVADLGRRSRSAGEELDIDPARLEELEETLTAIGGLKRKYGRTLEEVIVFGREAARRADELERLVADADQIDELVDSARTEIRERAVSLRRARESTAIEIVTSMQDQLTDLGLDAAQVEVDFLETEPGPSGADRVLMRFASDSRLEVSDVAAAASGGELSRLVLALRLATRARGTTTLVFDEVDTGIGGKTALAMGAKLAELATTAQVLCVTHLPQVAAHADTHYLVERGSNGLAAVRPVAGEDRVEEITRMLAGLPESEAGRTAASELLAGAHQRS